MSHFRRHRVGRRPIPGWIARLASRVDSEGHTVKRAGSALSVMLSAGVACGDFHGSPFCRSLAEMCPGVRLSGMGGARMAAAGLEIIADPTSRAVVGTNEALGRVPELYRAYRRLVNRLRNERPH